MTVRSPVHTMRKSWSFHTPGKSEYFFWSAPLQSRTFDPLSIVVVQNGWHTPSSSSAVKHLLCCRHWPLERRDGLEQTWYVQLLKNKSGRWSSLCCLTTYIPHERDIDSCLFFQHYPEKYTLVLSMESLWLSCSHAEIGTR